MPELGDFDVGIFLLLVLVSLESTEVESKLILVVLTPLRTKDNVAKEEQLELFCIQNDIFWLQQKLSELLVAMHTHVESSSSLIMRLLSRLEIHTMGVCD